MAASQLEVALVVGDLGPAKDLALVYRELEARQIPVRVFADEAGEGQRLFRQQEIPFENRGPQPGDDFLVFGGTSANASSLFLLWSGFARRRGLPLVWLEDLWGTAGVSVLREVDPDEMLVVHQTAAEIVQATRPHVKTTVVGKPAFEPFATWLQHPRRELRATLLQRLNLDPELDPLIVTYWSGGKPERIAPHLEAFHHIRGVGHRDVVFVPRLHPRLPAGQRLGLMSLCPAWAMHTQEITDLPPELLDCASDLVVGDHQSTEPYKATLYGTPTVITLFPEAREYLEMLGYPGGLPPLVGQGVAVGLWTPKDLVAEIREVEMVSSTSLEMNQRRAQAVFGDLLTSGTTARTVDVIQQYLSA